MNKKLLSKLVQLNNKKTDEYLVGLSENIKNEVIKSRDNEDIYSDLQSLGEFVYKTPNQALDVIRTVIKDKKSNKAKMLQGIVVGKRYNDLVLECIDLLNKLRYIRTKEVLIILMPLCLNENGTVKNEAIRTVERLAKYEFHALNKIGYTAQRITLDTILKLNKADKIKYLEPIKIIAKELFSPDFDGTEMKDYKTIVFKRGALQATPFLKKIRRETIDLIFSLSDSVENIKERISLFETLSYASYTTSYAVSNEGFEEIIIDDLKYLVKKYQKIIFNQSKGIIVDIPLVQEIEKQLVWFKKRYKDKITEATKLLDEIRKDDFYDLYRILVGYQYELKEDENWQEAEEKINKKIELEFSKVRKNNIKQWIRKLNDIAGYKDVVESGKFQNFWHFLFRIAKERPKLAGIILDDSLKNKKPIKDFIGQFLFGFREGGSLKLWDKYTGEIIKNQDINGLSGVLISISEVDLKSIRKKDIDLVSKIIKTENPFIFLTKISEDSLLNLKHSLVRTVVSLYAKDKKKAEGLIALLITKEKDKRILPVYVRGLSFPMHKGIIDFSGWDKNNRKALLDALVVLRRLDYDEQILMSGIAKADFPSAIDVLIGRIKKRVEIGEKEKKWISSTDYDAAPHTFHNELREAIINHKEEFIKIFESWTKGMTKKSSIYNIELAQLLQAMGESILNEVILRIIKKGGKNNLNKAIGLMWGINSPNFEICFEIIKRTDDKDIRNHLGGIMFNTGVVSGEYGIAKAYENKAKEIEEYKSRGTKKEIKRIKKFQVKIVKDLRLNAEKERQRADEEKKIMESGFE